MRGAVGVGAALRRFLRLSWRGVSGRGAKALPSEQRDQAHQRDAGDRPWKGGRASHPAVACRVAPAAVPHRWQNFAPGVRIVAQAAQRAPASGEPQLAQKRPLAAAPQLGQCAEPVAVPNALKKELSCVESSSS